VVVFLAGNTVAPVSVTIPAGITTKLPEATTKENPLKSSSSRPTTNETKKEEPGNGILDFGGSAGAYAGAAVAVIVIVPGLTFAAYFFWSRRVSNGSPLSTKRPVQGSSYKRGMKIDEDQEPVVDFDLDEAHDTYS
jgi:hypothetical protein